MATSENKWTNCYLLRACRFVISLFVMNSDQKQRFGIFIVASMDVVIAYFMNILVLQVAEIETCNMSADSISLNCALFLFCQFVQDILFTCQREMQKCCHKFQLPNLQSLTQKTWELIRSNVWQYKTWAPHAFFEDLPIKCVVQCAKKPQTKDNFFGKKYNVYSVVLFLVGIVLVGV